MNNTTQEYWDSLNPAQRAREAKRRAKKRKATIAARAAARAARRRTTSTRVKGHHEDHGHDIDHHVSYAYGHTEAWLGVYADAVGIPRSTLAHRVGDLLHRTARGPGLRTGDTLPALRRGAAH